MENLLLHFFSLARGQCHVMVAGGWLGCLRGFQQHFVKLYFSEGNATSVQLLLAKNHTLQRIQNEQLKKHISHVG